MQLQRLQSRRRTATAGCLIAAIVVAGASGGMNSRSSVGTESTPRVPTLFVSPAGNDANSCLRSSPCQSWNRAYQRARPGEIVEMAGGSYGRQLIRDRPTVRNLKPGCGPPTPERCIVFRPAAGEVVTINGSVEIQGSSIWLQGTADPSVGLPTRKRTFNIRVTGFVDTEAVSESIHPDHVVVEGVDATSFGVFGVNTATFRNMDIGPATVGARCEMVEGEGFENKIGFGRGILYVPRNVTLDGLLIHDQSRNTDGAASDCHFGGLFIVTVDGLVIRNTVFSRNAVYDIQVQNFGGAPAPTNVTIENNWFGCSVVWLYEPGGENRCSGQHDVQFNAKTQFANWLFRYNSFAKGIGQYVPGASYANVRITGNVGPRPQRCFDGMRFAYNAWVGQRCSPTDRIVGRLPFFSAIPGSEDFRLLPGTGAAGFVPAASTDLNIRRDIEGRVRPLRFPRDAGSVQRDTAVLVPGVRIGAAAISMTGGEVTRAYGRPRRSRAVALGASKALGRIDTFTVPGGALRVTTVNDRVVGLATASEYYTTPGGTGAGSSLRDFETLARTTWVPCRKAYVWPVAKIVVLFAAAPDKKKVKAVSMIRASYDLPCAKRP